MAGGGVTSSVDGLKVRFLGGFQILNDGQPVDGFDSFRLQSLFAYILLHPQAPLPRRQIAFLLWPDSTEEQAMANLRFLLFSLRRVLPDADRFLEVGARTVQIRADAAINVDVVEFERAAQSAQSLPDLKQAVQLYTGELLPGHYDDWILEERDRLQQMLALAIERQIALCERSKDYPSAIQAAQRLLQLDPLNENAYRRLMTLHALNHDQSAAVNLYHRCAEMLMRELGVRPDPKTQEIYELLLSVEGFPQPPDIASVVPLVGRTEEWQLLERAWNTAVGSRPHLVLLEGEAGIGKTRLAEEMVRWAGRQGIGCAAAHCFAAEGALAFGPLTEWLRERPIQSVQDARLVEAVRLLPEIAIQRPDLPAPTPLQEGWQRQVFFEALAHMIVGDQRALLLWIDDVHWCDQDTIEWLRYFMRFHTQVKVLVLGTAREEELESNPPLVGLAAALESSGQITRIPLAPLDAAETSALGEQFTGRPIHADLAGALYKESEGNPLFILELLRARMSEEQAETAGSQGSPGGSGWGWTPRIQQVIQERLRLVSPEARELAGLASTLGNTFLYKTLASAGGLEERELVVRLDELWRKGILREQGGEGYVFSHDKIREVIYAGLSQARRRLLHRQAAQAIEAAQPAGTDHLSAQVAYHFDRAGDTGRAVEHYLRAARHATRLFSNAEAITLLQRGLELLHELPDTPERDRMELAYQLAFGGVHLSRQIRAPEVRQSYARAYQLAEKVGSDREQFDALKGVWEVDNYWLNLEKARDLGGQMLATARRHDQVELLINAHYSLGTTAFLTGDFEQSKAHLAEGLRLNDVHPHAMIAFHGAHPGVGCQARLAWTLCFLGEAREAFRAAGEAAQRAEVMGHPYSRCMALTLDTFLNLMFRKKECAAALGEEAIRLATHYDYRFWIGSATRMVGWATLAPGAGAAWDDLLENENQMWHSVHSVKPAIWFSLSQSLYIEGLAASGRPEQGLARLQEVFAKLAESPEMIWVPELQRLKGDLLLQLGAPADEARGWYRRGIETARAQQSRLLELRGAASLCRLELQAGSSSARDGAVEALENLAGWFPADLDLPDLQDARGLLAQIS